MSVDELTDGGSPDWRERFFGRVLRNSVRREHPVCLSLMTRYVQAIRTLPIHEHAQVERDFAAEVAVLPRDEAVLSRLLLPTLERVGAASRRYHAWLRCLGVAIAIERYRLANKGQWPDTLAQLTPKFLPEVPLDPFDGEPLRYKTLSDGVVVYSVGPDEADDGGKIDRKHPIETGTDMGCRLWDVKHRRQAARPKPPPPEGPGIGPGGPGEGN